MGYEIPTICLIFALIRLPIIERSVAHVLLSAPIYLPTLHGMFAIDLDTLRIAHSFRRPVQTRPRPRGPRTAEFTASLDVYDSWSVLCII